MHAGPQSIEGILTPTESSLATSLWPITRVRKELNIFQKQALNLASVNKFTLIQGPPGKIIQLAI